MLTVARRQTPSQVGLQESGAALRSLCAEACEVWFAAVEYRGLCPVGASQVVLFQPSPMSGKPYHKNYNRQVNWKQRIILEYVY